MAPVEVSPGDRAVQRRNDCLEHLHEIFPEADVGDLRYRINAKFKEHLELSEQLKQLLEQSQMGKMFKKQPGNGEPLQPFDRFRSNEYAKAVEKNLGKEFKNLSRSTILAVMAENNNHYARSRTSLIDISKKSWRTKISNWFFRRPKTEEHKAVPTFAATGCQELDDELWALGSQGRKDQCTSDQAVAQALNEKEYEKTGDLLECECCFGDYAFESMTACCDGHLFCHTCVVHAAKEGVYGQTTSLVKEKGSLRCLSSVADPPCDGYIPLDLAVKALPEDILKALENKFIDDDLTQSGLPISKCPFCMYGEADEVPEWRLKKNKLYGLAALALFLMTASLLLVLLPVAAFVAAVGYIYLIEAVAANEPVHMEKVAAELMQCAVKNQWEKKRGQMFHCKASPDKCAKKSCRDCGKEWKAFHKCFENEEESLRLYMENAMAAAIKRTCPSCGTSFVKSDGCNKLVCVCGYIMCYVCRADIKEEKYKHFCQHFRQIPGTACSECDKCDLYVQEDESSVVKKAGEKARADWLAKNSGAAGWKPTRQVVAGYTFKSKAASKAGLFSKDAFVAHMESIKMTIEDNIIGIFEIFVEFEKT